MKIVYAGLVLVMALALLSGCGLLKPSSGGDRFEWEYLFEDGSGAGEDSREKIQEKDAISGRNGDYRRTSAAYRLQFDDVVSISLLGIREFQNQIEARVDDNGEISMPYIDNVKAEGKTSSELGKHIKNLYIEKGIYKDLNVRVIIPSQNSYYIRGEVKRPGGYPWKSGITLSQAISSAAGITEYASDKVILTRKGQVETFDIGDIEKNPSKDIVLRPDDQIRVKRSIF